MNKYSRYITVFSITIFGMTLSYRIGNPLWFIQEFKNIREEEKEIKKKIEKIKNL